MHQGVDHRHLTVLEVVGRTEDETGISLIERLACPLDDRGKVAVLGERHHQTDQPGSSARQGTGAAMGDVAYRTHVLENEVASRLRDIGPPVEDAGDGSDGNAGERSNVAHRRAGDALGRSFIVHRRNNPLISGSAYNYTEWPI